jgi:hypothetical protein
MLIVDNLDNLVIPSSSHFTAGVNWVFSDFGAPTAPVAKQLGLQIREMRINCCSIESSFLRFPWLIPSYRILAPSPPVPILVIWSGLSQGDNFTIFFLPRIAQFPSSLNSSPNSPELPELPNCPQQVLLLLLFPCGEKKPNCQCCQFCQYCQFERRKRRRREG